MIEKAWILIVNCLIVIIVAKLWQLNHRIKKLELK